MSDGFGSAATELDFTLTDTSGTWANAASVLTQNADGWYAAAHIGVCDTSVGTGDCTSAGNQVATGYAAAPAPRSDAAFRSCWPLAGCCSVSGFGSVTKSVVRLEPLSRTRRREYYSTDQSFSVTRSSWGRRLSLAAKVALVLAGAAEALAVAMAVPAIARLVFVRSDVVGGSGFGCLLRALTHPVT